MRRLLALLALDFLFLSPVAHGADIYNPVLSPVVANTCLGVDRIVNPVVSRVPNPNFPDDRYRDIETNALPNGYPYNELVLGPFYMGQATANPVTFDAGAYTGLHLDSDHQRGRSDQASSTIFQLSCNQWGFLVDTDSIDRYANLAFASFGVTWNIPRSLGVENEGEMDVVQPNRLSSTSPAIRPWDSTGDPDLVIETWARIPTMTSRGDGTGQLNISFYALDTTTGKFLSYIIDIANNVGYTSASQPAFDGQFPFISSMLPINGTEICRRHFTLSPHSQGGVVGSWPEWRFFRVHINRRHIVNAVDDINYVYGRGLSRNPADYLLTSVNLLQEHAYSLTAQHPPQQPNGNQLFMASSFKDFAIYVADNAQVPASITAVSGSGQSANPGGQAFGQPLKATLRDASGNPVEGVPITFTGPANGAGTSPTVTTATTNCSGDAEAQLFTNGVEGTYSVVAAIGNLATSFTLTNIPSPPGTPSSTPASITVVAGGPQATTVNTAFPSPLQVKVRDASGNPVQGATVTFSTPTSGASALLSPAAPVTTGADGTATVTATANGIAGGYNVNAVVTGVTRAATFELANTVVNAPLFRGSSSIDGSGTLSVPAGTQTTDWLVMHLISTSPFSTPPGWTLGTSLAWPSGAGYSYLFYRQAGSWTGMTIANAGGTAMMAAYGNTTGIGTVGAFGLSTPSAATIAPGNLVLQNANSLVVGFVSDHEAVAPTPPAGFTTRVSRLSPGFGHNIADRIFGVSSVRGQAWAQSVSQPAAGVMVELKP